MLLTIDALTSDLAAVGVVLGPLLPHHRRRAHLCLHDRAHIQHLRAQVRAY